MNDFWNRRFAGRDLAQEEQQAEPQVQVAGANVQHFDWDIAAAVARPRWHRVEVIRDEMREYVPWLEQPFKVPEVPNKGKTGEELFHLILSGIREIYDVDATIAGGAVRDFITKVNYLKDVDVFIPMKWADFEPSVAELGWQQTPFRLKEGGYETCVIPSTARGQASVQHRTVDLVFMDNPLTPEDVAKFPIHAQRCVWTLNEGLSISPEAKQDIENKTFTIDHTITDKERLKKVVKKAQEWCKRPGYEGWKVVEPDIAEWWEVKKEAAERKYLPGSTSAWTQDHWTMYWENKLNVDESGRYYIKDA
jgi:hypothetical protein